MPAQPILELFTRLNRSPADNVTIGLLSDTKPWRNAQVPLIAADPFAEAMAAQGENIYIMVNDAMPIEGNKRGKIEHITRLNALWADFDYKADGVLTEENARKVTAFLSDLLNAEPVAIVHSGHGMQPYWEFDAEDGAVTDDNRTYMAHLTRRWGILVTHVADQFSLGVDSVFDLPRVLRAPGPMNLKDADNPAPTSVEFNDAAHAVTLSEVEDLLNQWGIGEEQVAHLDLGERPVQVPSVDWQMPEQSCIWSHSFLSEIPDGRWTARHPTAVAKTINLYAYARYGCLSNEDFAHGLGLIRDKFLAELSSGDGEKRKPVPREFESIARHAISVVERMTEGQILSEVNNHPHNPLIPSPNLGEGSGSGEEDTATEPDAAPVEEGPRNVAGYPLLEETPFTEAWNGELLSHELNGRFLFVPEMGWHIWDGTRYAPDRSAAVVRQATICLRKIPLYGPGTGSNTWRKKSMSKANIKNSIEMAAGFDSMFRLPEDLDAEPFDLVTPGGIVNLRDGVLREADPNKDFNTKSTIVAPAAGPHPKWDEFLLTILEHQDKVDYVQGLLGIALVGKTVEQVVPLFSGTGANGKSTTTDLVSRILGSYAAALPENFFLEQSHQEHSTELAGLQGVRFATASETKPNGVFNESRLKALSGGDMIRARRMRQDFYDFVPSHSSFINLNHKPQIRAGGDSFFRRIKVVNFGYQVPAEERNAHLGDELFTEEGPQILQWLIEGCQRVLHEGLYEPTVITLDTKNYQSEEDSMHQFILENVQEVPGPGIPRDVLYTRYLGFSSRERLDDQLSSQQFMREFLARIGAASSYTERGVRMVRNISLIETEQFGGAGTGPGSAGYEPREFTDE